ncbi:geranylgeranyl diphosphate synthase type I [Streptomyces umbrinus]|uniref:polyprenyl synthetase family protein n=1 Tax=Streptomyces umbrinus TaxID=67370 RepID=UPI00167ED3B6|nr:polyprenyl synthetase family protein [Streptomyces umbrinus]MCR3725201.1 geranylgeranyl diphosphate synthase type I [Streptomyces umbrinus]GHH63253.1 dimethylallyltransferase [Streptomyces umbrinus]
MNQTEVLSAPAADTVTETLAECRAATVPALRTVVEALHPRLARISAYHLGWCRPDGTPADGHAGKMLRAALAMLAARAFGASTASAVPGAVAVELVHNFSLLHDDLMDADELRRGRSTAWVVFGRGPAVLAGDALLSQALRVVTEVRGTAGQPATEVMTSAVNAIIQGQAADLELDGLPVDEVDTDDYLTACAKTSGLLGGCLEVGAVLAHAPAPAARMLRSAAWDLGVAWQIADDIESLWGDPAASGKDSYGDLRSGKRTYPVIAALRSETAAGSRLAARLSATETPAEDELAALAGLVEEAGGRAAAERAARRYLDQALHSLSRAGGEAGAVDILTALFRHVLARHERWTTRVPTAPATKGAAR